MKTLMAATTLALALGTSAQAQDMFAYMGAPQSEFSSVIVIEPLTASANGFIAIYDFHAGQVGDLLGVASVNEGANRETRVTLGRPVTRDVIAYLFEGSSFDDPSQAIDSIEIDIEG